MPCLKFVGKTDRIVDRFGEKLNVRHVRRVLSEVFNDHGVEPEFSMVAPDDRSTPGYTLFVQTETRDSVLRTVAQEIENGLRDNYHYNYYRRLGQLGRLRLFRITGDAPASYLNRCVANGQRAGDVKPTGLHPATNWGDHFDGHLLEDPG